MVEDADDDGIGVEHRRPAQERQGVFVGADGGGAGARQADIKLGEPAAAPAQDQMRPIFVAEHGDADLFEQGPQKFLFVAGRGGGGRPDVIEVLAERQQRVAFGGGQRGRALPLAAADRPGLGQVRASAAPIRFRVRVRPAGFPARRRDSGVRPFPLRSGRARRPVATGRGRHRGRFRVVARPSARLGCPQAPGFQKSVCHRLVDLHTADVEAVDTPPADDVFARTMVAGGGVPSAIVGAQAPPAVAADGEALQQRTPFAQRAAPVVGLRVGVAVEPSLDGLVSGQVDIAFMVPGNENGRLRLREAADAFPDLPLFVDVTFIAGFSIAVGTGIHRIGRGMVDRDIGGQRPAGFAGWVGLMGKAQAFGMEPEPDPARRTQFGEAFEHRADGGNHRRVGVEAHLAVLVAPNEANGQSRRSSPRAALLRMPPSSRARKIWSSASLIVPLSPSNSRSLNSPG